MFNRLRYIEICDIVDMEDIELNSLSFFLKTCFQRYALKFFSGQNLAKFLEKLPEDSISKIHFGLGSI